jgi:hypothetical protein
MSNYDDASSELTYTLIIWQEIPENCKLYLVPNELITPEHAQLIAEANGKIINADDDCDGLLFLNAAISEVQFDEDLQFHEQCGLYVNLEVDALSIKNVKITSVCLTGFLL